MRDSFVFYRSFVNSAKKLSPELRFALYEAIIDYALDDIAPGEDADFIVSALMAAIAPQIDANNKRFENGKKGGRPKGSVSNSETNGSENKNHRFSDEKPNVDVDVYADVDVNADGDGDVSGSEPNADASSLSLSLIGYLNEKTGSRYKPGTAVPKIQSLLDQGYTEADMKKVIDRKYAEWWSDEKMRDYLRPSTLFGSKFSEYLNAPISLQGERQQKHEENRDSLLKEKAEKTEALKAIRESIEEMKDKDGRIRENITEYRALKDQAAILEDSLKRIDARLGVS